jgi:hypothetical protein
MVPQSARNHFRGKQTIMVMVASIGDVPMVADPPSVEVFDVLGVAQKNIGNRIGKCGRERKENGALSSNKLKKPMRGAKSFLEY